MLHYMYIAYLVSLLVEESPCIIQMHSPLLWEYSDKEVMYIFF